MDASADKTYEGLAHIYEDMAHKQTLKEAEALASENRPGTEPETKATLNAPAKKSLEPLYTGYTIISDRQILFHRAAARTGAVYVATSRGIGTMKSVCVSDEEFTAEQLKENRNNAHHQKKIHPDDRELFQKAYEKLFPFRF